MAYGRVNVGSTRKELKNVLTTKYTIVQSFNIGQITAMGINNKYLIQGNIVGNLRCYDISKEDEEPSYKSISISSLSQIKSISINKNNFLCVGDSDGKYIIKNIDISTGEIANSSLSIQIMGIINSNRYERETFIIVYRDGYAKCVDEKDNVLWAKEIKETIESVSKTQDNDLVVAIGQRQVICFDKNTGIEKWRTVDLGENILAIDTYLDNGIIAFGASKKFFRIYKNGTYDIYDSSSRYPYKLFYKKNGYFFGVTSLTSTFKFPITLFNDSFKVSNEFGIGLNNASYENAISNNNGVMAISWVIGPNVQRGVTIYYTDVYI